MIEYLQVENQSLREQVGNKRIRWTDAQRRRLEGSGWFDATSSLSSTTRYLSLDRDPLYGKAFRTMLKDASVEIVRLPSRSPNLNSYAERWVRSLREESLNRIIPLDEKHLRRTLASYVEHYHMERKPPRTWQSVDRANRCEHDLRSRSHPETPTGRWSTQLLLLSRSGLIRLDRVFAHYGV